MVIIKQVFGYNIPVNTLAAHLYLNEAERMPDDASDEWFMPFETRQDDNYINRVINFLTAMDDVLQSIEGLSEDATEEDIQFHFYEAGKLAYGEDRKALREFFRMTYFFLFNSWSGPRLGQFVKIQGVEAFSDMVIQRLWFPQLMPLDNL